MSGFFVLMSRVSSYEEIQVCHIFLRSFNLIFYSLKIVAPEETRCVSVFLMFSHFGYTEEIGVYTGGIGGIEQQQKKFCVKCGNSCSSFSLSLGLSSDYFFFFGIKKKFEFLFFCFFIFYLKFLLVHLLYNL